MEGSGTHDSGRGGSEGEWMMRWGRDHMGQNREGRQMSEDGEGLKGASLIARLGGEQMARGRMVQKMTRQERGPHWLNAERQKALEYNVRR